MAVPIEDYALIGDTHTAALVEPAGLDRLAVPAPLRLAGLLRGPARRPRPTAAGCSPRPGRSGRSGAATRATPWCWRPSTGPTTGSSGWSTACRPRQWRPGRGQDRRGGQGPGADADGADHPLRLRLDRALGPAHRRGRCTRSPGPTRCWLRTPVPVRGENWTSLADFTVGRGRAGPVHAHLACLAPPGPAADRPRRRPSATPRPGGASGPAASTTAAAGRTR